MNDGVLIAVDPHKAHNTLVVLDPATRTPVDEGEFANTDAVSRPGFVGGYDALASGMIIV